MNRRLRPALLALVSLSAMLGMPRPSLADDVFETEPNDTFATANKTVGLNNLGFFGFLTLGDIDVFSIYAIPDATGTATIGYDVFWASGVLSGPSTKWLNVRVNATGGFTGGGQGGQHTGNIATFGGVVPSTYYFQIFSSSPGPNPLGPVTGSTVEGAYSITNIRGLNGTIVQGTAVVPEPGTMALLAGLGVSSLLVVRRMRRRNR